MASSSVASVPGHAHGKSDLVQRLLHAKEKSGLSFSQIGEKTGLTNVYAAQLFYNQAQLKPGTVDVLKSVVPGISNEDLQLMQRAPIRRYDPDLIQDPSVYRLNEGLMHSAEALKAIMNEEFGDGIMSAIDFYCSVDKVEGTQGEKRVVVTMNGKYLPHVEQRVANNVAQRKN